MHQNNSPYTSNQLVSASQHRGYEMQTHRGKLAKVHIDAATDVIENFVNHHPRTFAVRVDLRYPEYYSLEERPTRNSMRRFFESLNSQIEAERKRALKASTINRVHETKLGYVWAREYGPQSHRPHFHVLILLNRDVYRTLGSISIERDNMYARIVKAWARSLGLEPEEAVGLVHISKQGQYHVFKDDRASVAELIQRVSYLCKLETKKFNNGEHTFGASRVLKK